MPSTYGIFDEDGNMVAQDWVVDPESARIHMGHRCTVSIYAGRNLAIECEDCQTLIGDIDFMEHTADDPSRHCFREGSPTDACEDCGQPASIHTGCDCE